MSLEERKQAALDSESLVDDVMVWDLGSLQVYHDMDRPGSHASNLLLETAQIDGSQLGVGVHTRVGNEDVYSESREITIQEITKNDRGGQFRRYYIDERGNLHRFDRDFTARALQSRARRLGVNVDSATFEQDLLSSVQREMDDLVESKENMKLERQMGVNEQFVGSAEILKLRAIIEEAHVRRRW